MIARQREAVRRADAVANRAERAVQTWWRDLIAILRAAPQYGPGWLYRAATAHYQRLPVLTRTAIADGLVGVWQWGDETARRGIPKTVLRRVASGRLDRNQSSLAADFAAKQGGAFPQVASPHHGTNVLGSLSRHRVLDGVLTEGTDDLPRRNAPRRAPARDPLFVDIIPVGILPDTPASKIPDDLLARVVLHRPSEALIRRRVDQLIAPFLATPRPDLVDPRLHANQLVASYLQGKGIDEIARDLLPVAEGVKASARRVARTWSMHVANQSQWEAHERLSEVVIGYQIHATPSPDSREWHSDRDGTEYFRNPGPGQKGFDQLPHPPQEAADPRERPLGTPFLAWNCRCFLTPIFAEVRND